MWLRVMVVAYFCMCCLYRLLYCYDSGVAMGDLMWVGAWYVPRPKFSVMGQDRLHDMLFWPSKQACYKE